MNTSPNILSILIHLKYQTSLFVLLFLLSVPVLSQQRRGPAAKVPPKQPATQAAPTFDTLLSADSYKIYGEVRGVGQLIRSSAVSDLIEPVLKLSGPPREFKTAVKWLTAHSDAVATSRLMFATWPTARNVPDVLIAIEFASPDEAAQFEPQLNQFLPKVLPTPAPDETNKETQLKQSPPATKEMQTKSELKPTYYLKRSGSLLFITPTPLTLKNLRPASGKLLADDPDFRTVHDRFASESVFVYVDVKAIVKEDSQRQEEMMKEMAQREKEQADTEKTIPKTEQTSDEVVPEEPPPPVVDSQPNDSVVQIEQTQPDPMSLVMMRLGSAFFSGEPKWPEAIGIAAVFDVDSYNLRLLLVNPPGEKSSVIPFFPLLMTGPALTPESPSLLPSDTELFATLSLDLPQMYAGLNKPTPRDAGPMATLQPIKDNEADLPFAALEKKLGIKIKDDLLPLLGNEVTFSMPVKVLDAGPPVAPAPDEPKPEPDNAAKTDQPASFSPIVALSLRDKEGMQRLLPKIVEAWGFKGASAFAQTEKREDTEIVSYAGVFSYAFVGSFLVMSTDAKTVHHVVDSYLKRDTLTADPHFKNFTRWQPRQMQGQVYVSPALMESYKSWANEPTPLISDQTKEFFMTLSGAAEPVTYSLSNEGFGPFHELHIPKDLALMAVAGLSGEATQPPSVTNERVAVVALYSIARAELQLKGDKGAGSYATLEQLITDKHISRDIVENHGYRFEITISADSFEISAMPIEYGKTGRTSYYTDQTNVIRGGDHGGGPATISDKPVH